MTTTNRAQGGQNHARLLSRCRIISMLCCLFAVSVSGGFGQSLDVRDGSNAVGLSGQMDLESDMSIRRFEGRSAYSIAGVLDVGVAMSNTIEEIGDTVGNVQTLSLVYSIIPVKQQRGLPVSLLAGLSYGLSFVDSALVRAELERDIDRFGADSPDLGVRSYDGSRTGYTLSALLSSDVPFNERFALRLGAGGEYRVERTSYTAFLSTGAETDDDGDIELIGDRKQRMYFGPGIGLVYRSPRGRVISVNNRLLFDESFGFEYRPEISLAVLQS